MIIASIGTYFHNYQAVDSVRPQLDPEAMKAETCRQPAWSESVAVGGKKYVEKIKEELGCKAIGRKIHEGLLAGANALREPAASYSIDSGMENEVLSDGNSLFWSIFPELSGG